MTEQCTPQFAVRLPWPPAVLSPNSRAHWGKRSRAAKSYRKTCHMLAAAALRRRPAPELGEEICMTLIFCPPDRRRRDDDNLVAAFKAGRDGLADALGIDDAVFRTMPIIGEPSEGHVDVYLFRPSEAPA